MEEREKKVERVGRTGRERKSAPLIICFSGKRAATVMASATHQR